MLRALTRVQSLCLPVPVHNGAVLRACVRLFAHVHVPKGAENEAFQTLVLGNKDGPSGWVELSALYGSLGGTASTVDECNGPGVDGDPASRQRINTPGQLLFVARRGLRCQIFDTKLWHDLYEAAVTLRADLTPPQWVELLHIFKRIKIRSPELMDMALSEVLYKLERLSLCDLSKLALSFAFYQCCPSALFSRIGAVVTTRLHHQAMQEVPGTCDTDTPSPASSKNVALARITSYTHLLGAFSKCDYPHKELFEAVARDLLVQLQSKELLIPPGFLVKLFASYARFGYRHAELFDVLCRELVTAKLSVDELSQLRGMMIALDYFNEPMFNVFAYRLGNSVEARS